MNNNLGLQGGQVQMFLKSVRMRITFERRHEIDGILPSTHDRGSNCLDMIGCSDHIPETAIINLFTSIFTPITEEFILTWILKQYV